MGAPLFEKLSKINKTWKVQGELVRAVVRVIRGFRRWRDLRMRRVSGATGFSLAIVLREVA